MTKLTKILLIISFALISLGFGLVFGLIDYYKSELPPLTELKHYDMKVGSDVFDKDGNLIHTFAFEKRKLTNISKLPNYITEGILALEDQGFNDHWGVDLKGILRAAIVNFTSGSMAQGASTITQQLARNMFLSFDKKIARKIKEVILAVRIESHYSKEEILEMYFNKVSFGPGIYGIESISKKLYDKEAKDLTIAEASVILGLPQRPSSYYPIRNPKLAIKRRNIVLKALLKEKIISQEVYKTVKNSELNLNPSKPFRHAQDYFIEEVRKITIKKYGADRLFGGGLKIYTTIDTSLTNYADSVFNQQLTNLEPKIKRKAYTRKDSLIALTKYKLKIDTLDISEEEREERIESYKEELRYVRYSDLPKDTIDIKTNYVQGGVLTMENSTGYVRVLIGGRNCNHSKYNRILQAKRQPGSSYKPIIYTAAVAQGYTPSTVINDVPFVFVKNDSIFWNLNNYSYKNYGHTRLREGLKKSRNIFAAKLLYDIGPEMGVKYGKLFGLKTRILPTYSLSVGTSEVRPVELISAYTTFPNNGNRVEPIYIKRIEDEDGYTIFSAKRKAVKVIDEKVAYIMANLMTSVINEGTGAGVRWRGYRWNGAGKTGTTDDFRDAWFIGYNKRYVTGIWVGFDDNRTLGRGISGATAALPAWPYIMRKAIENESPKNEEGEPIIDASAYEFEKPAGIIKKRISKKTGLIPKNEFEETMDEVFILGTEPTPFMDTLKYNFNPTMYKYNPKDSLIVNLGLSDSLTVSEAKFDPSNALFIDNKTKTYVDSLPFYQEIDSIGVRDSLQTFENVPGE